MHQCFLQAFVTFNVTHSFDERDLEVKAFLGRAWTGFGFCRLYRRSGWAAEQRLAQLFPCEVLTHVWALVDKPLQSSGMTALASYVVKPALRLW